MTIKFVNRARICERLVEKSTYLDKTWNVSLTAEAFYGEAGVILCSKTKERSDSNNEGPKLR